jgi:DNA-binding GntR family transcriptional regulator
MPGSSDRQRSESRSPEEAGAEDIPDRIYDTVISAILDRALDPGTKLPEDVFCNHYGVSRTLVRVAIHRLQYDKLVEIQRNRGCFVVIPTTAEAVDVLGGRKAVEPFIARRACEVASVADIERLRAHVELEDQAYRQNDHRAALRLSGQFHLLLGRIANSGCLSDFLHNLVCRSALVIATFSDVTSCCKAHDHHRLVELLSSREADKAARHMTAHLDHIERDLLHGKDDEEKPTLESVLTRYSKGASLSGKARKLTLIAPASE